MAQEVTFGLTLPQRGALFGATSLPELVALAQEADELGLFDSLWVGDSLLAKPRPDSLSLLGGLATATKRLTLGVGCMASFPLRDPLVFAYQWATLDLLSQGRVLLAACTGIVRGGPSAHEGEQWGVEDRERAARLAENIRLCRRLWQEEHVTFEGRFHSYHDVTIEPRPVQDPPPIWIASNPTRDPERPRGWERALRRVARLADGWMTVQLFPRMLETNWTRIRELLEQSGRDVDRFPTIAYHNINIGSDRRTCLEQSKRFLDEYYGPVFSPPMVEAWTAAGTPDECVEHLRGLAAEGARGITLRCTSWDQRGQFKRMVNEVLPRVNDR